MKTEPVCYLLNYPRPIGLEPTIYLSCPKIDYTPVEVEPGYFMEDCQLPEIVPCYSFSDALSRIMHFNIRLALEEFSIVR